MKISKLNRQTTTEMVNNVGESIHDWVRCGAHRSRQATLTELTIQLGGFKRQLSNEKSLQLALERAAHKRQESFQSEKKLGAICRQFLAEPAQTYVLNEKQELQKAVIYLPGGAYFHQPRREQWRYAAHLAKISGARVYIVDYPSLPDHTFMEAYAALETIYQKIYDEVPVSDISLVGDSAGGGLAAGFCEYCALHDLPQPGHLVLLSPWLDLDLANPTIDQYQKLDATLQITGLKMLGNMWAADANHTDYRLSPINGDVEAFRQVLICVGTKEIMYPDSAKFVRKLRDINVPVKFIVGRDLPHAFAIYPMPESDRVMAEVAKMINEEEDE